MISCIEENETYLKRFFPPDEAAFYLCGKVEHAELPCVGE
jgi:hypothetical protein